jgi:replicative DNA helicase
MSNVDAAARNLLGALYLRPDMVPTAQGVLNRPGLIQQGTVQGRIWTALVEHTPGGKRDAAGLQTTLDRVGGAWDYIRDAQAQILNPRRVRIEEVAGWAATIAEAGNRTLMAAKLQRLQEEVNDLSIPLDDIVGRTMQELAMPEGGTGNTWRSLADITPNARRQILAYKDADAELPGVPTGFPTLDKVLFRLPNGEVVIVGARPSVGKTVFATQVLFYNARRIKQENRPECVAMFSLETSGELLVIRMACAEAGVDQMKLKQGNATLEEQNRVLAVLDEMDQLPFYIDESPNPTTENMLVRTLALQNVVIGGVRRRVALMGFDFMELAGEEDSDEQSRISRVMRGLKVAAKILDCPILALSQLGRQVDTRKNKLPNKSDLSWSSLIEKIAYQIILLHRPAYYAKNDPGYDPRFDPHYREAIFNVDKNKDGPTGLVPLGFVAEHVRFYDPADTESDYEPPSLVDVPTNRGPLPAMPPQYGNGWEPDVLDLILGEEEEDNVEW